MIPQPRRRWLACLAGVLALLAAPPLQAQVPAPRPLRAVALKIGPWGALDAQGRPSGAFVEAYALLGKEIGRRIDVTVVPYARAIAMLRSGDIDFMLATSNEAIAQASEPLGALWEAEVIVIGRLGLRLDGQRDLRGLTVGMVRGSNYGAAFMDDHEYRRYETNDQVHSMRMLMEERIDASVGTRLAIADAMRTLGLRRSQVGDIFPIQSREVHLHMSNRRADEALAADLRRAIFKLRQNGKAAAILARYPSI